MNKQQRLESLMGNITELLLSTAATVWPDRNPEIMGRGLVVDKSPILYWSVVDMKEGQSVVWITTNDGIWRYTPFLRDESTIEGDEE